MSYQIQVRRDAAADWTSENPTIAEGEFGYETDTGKLKVGDGVTAWTSLGYFGGVDSDAIHDNVGGEIHAVSLKGTPVGADELLIEDSAASWAKKRIAISTLSVGGGDPDAIHDNVTGEINAIASKSTPVAADEFVIEDSAASYAKKKTTLSEIEAVLDHDSLSGVSANEHLDWTLSVGTIHTDNYIEGGAGTDTTALHDNVSAEISAITEKTAPVGDDLFVIEDSAASNAKKRLKVENLPIPWENVVDYGADPTGVSDSSTAVTNADAAGCAYFPPGTYLLTDVTFNNPPVFEEHVTIDVSGSTTYGIRFLGIVATQQYSTVTGGVYVHCVGDTGSFNVVEICGTSWVIPKLRIVGGGTTQSHVGLKVYPNAGTVAASHIHVPDLRISNCDIAMVMTSDTTYYVSNCIFGLCYFQTCNYGLKYVYPATGTSGKFIKNRFQRLYLETITNYGIWFDGSTRASNIVGINDDMWIANFDSVTTDLYADWLQPTGILIDQGLDTLTEGTANSGSLDGIERIGKDITWSGRVTATSFGLNDAPVVMTCYNNTGGSLSKGDLCYIDGDQSGTPRLALADADAASTCTGALVMANETIGSASSGECVVFGWVSGLTSLTAGAKQYVSTTGGDITETAPSGTGDIVRTVGYAMSTTEIFFNPGGSWVEVA